MDKRKNLGPRRSLGRNTETVEKDRSVDALLRVGAVVVLHVHEEKGQGPRFRSFVRGWRRGSHIILDRPRLRGSGRELEAGQTCLVRFISEGHACAFETSLLGCAGQGQGGHCDIAWPAEVDIVPFRRYYRIKVNLACHFTADGCSGEGEIRDLSMGGCAICTRQALPQGVSMQLAFTLPDGLPLEGVHGIIRDVRPLGQDFLVGCEFCHFQEHVQSDIAFSLSTTFEHQRDHKDRPVQILIIDANEATAAALQGAFEQKGLSTAIAAGTIDGLQRLRMAPPAALIVSLEQRDLTALDIARLVKLTPGFDLLPIFVYGEGGEETRQQALQSGVREFFPFPFDAGEIRAAVAKLVAAV